jgi:hypothetical protein
MNVSEEDIYSPALKVGQDVSPQTG